jgi:hypothetical protein
MAICKFCGQPAGFLHHEHEECQKRHDSAVTDIWCKVVSAFKGSVDLAVLHSDVEREAEENFVSEIERNQIVRDGMAKVIADATQIPIAETDYARIVAIRHALSLTDDDLGNAASMLQKSLILKYLEEGKIDKVKTSFSGRLAPRLDKDEHGIWAFSAVNYLVTKHRTQYVGGSSGISIRVMKGIYYRVGAFKSTPVHSEFLSVQDTGGFSITDRNVYFVGSNVAVKLPLKKIVSVQLHTDGIEILQSGVSKKPLTLEFDDPVFAANLLARLAGR